jgi:hypothetical protein
MANIKVLTGHLTATEKSVINQMLHLNITQGKTPKKLYNLSKENNLYTVSIFQNDRGLIPCPGSQLRQSKNTSTFKTTIT